MTMTAAVSVVAVVLMVTMVVMTIRKYAAMHLPSKCLNS